MNITEELLPYLIKIHEVKKCAINVSKVGEEVSIGIIGRFRTKRFRNTDSFKLISELKSYMQA